MKKHLCRGKRHIGNRGFSLVELLVAVVILGIIVGPLLHVFLSGANTTARSKKMSDATLAFQNIAETIEANSLAALVKDENTLYGGPAESTQASGIYSLVVPDVKAGGTTFNAAITFDPNTTDDDGIFKEINSRQMTDYTNMDAVFAQTQNNDSDPDKLAWDKFNVELAKHTGAAFVSEKRQITLDITKGDGKLFASLTYHYAFAFTEQTAVNGVITTVNCPDFTDTESYTLFPQGFSTEGGAAPGIYIMYNPMYDAAGGDKITINNNDDLNFRLFLVKQKTAAANTERETSYKATVKFQKGSNDCEAQVFSNAKINLINNSAITNVHYSILIGIYQEAPNPLFDGEKQGDLVSKTVRDRFYKVTIKLYPESDSNCTGPSLSTFYTTKLQ